MRDRDSKGRFLKGVPHPPKKKEVDLDYCKRKYLEGYSCSEISKKFNVDESTIRNRFKEINFSLRKNTEHSNRTKQKISQTLKSKGIKPKIINRKPTKGCFKKGESSWNKGIKTGQKNWKKRTFTEETIKKIKQARANQILPLKDTSIEIKLQNFLRRLNIEFYTHQYMREIEHAYQCDIFIPVQKGIERPIIIEAFGDYWHNIPYGNPIDSIRCNELREKGFRVLVFWEREIKVMQLNDLKKEILK